jgi:hypothetical protein
VPVVAFLGRDNWQLTCADDDRLYGAWRDGRGLGGSRASLGFAFTRDDELNITPSASSAATTPAPGPKNDAIFEDRESGVGCVSSVCYNAGLKRFILMTGHVESSLGNTIHFKHGFGAGHVPLNAFLWNMPAKDNDSLNLIRGRFHS